MNLKTKTNTVKQILAKVMLFVMLVVYLLNLSACRDPNCAKGDFYTSMHASYQNRMKVVAQRNNFELNNITLDLYIGLEKKKDYSILPKYEGISRDELVVDKSSKEPYFIVGVTTDDVLYPYCHDEKYDIYQYVYENMLVIKEIPYKDKDKFPYVRTFGGRKIDYSTNITIPMDLIKNTPGERGEIIFFIAEFFHNGKKYVESDNVIEILSLDYYIENENMVHITFTGYAK